MRGESKMDRRWQGFRLTIKSTIILGIFCSLPAMLYSQAFQNVPTQNGFYDWATSHSFGAGCSFFDFNKDGLDDMTFCFNRTELLIYENNGNGFDLVPQSFTMGHENTHAVWADYDNDGDLDLFISGFNAKNRLYRNNGSFNFTDVTEMAGLPVNVHNTAGVSFGDYDRDGYLDLFVATYTDPDNPFDEINRLYHNNGNGTFTDVTSASGVNVTMYFSFISIWIDYNNDLWPDIYVINDKFPGNALFRNNGDGTFTDVTAVSGTSYPFQDPMSATPGDYDNDGDLDVYMSNSGGPAQPPILMTNNGDETFSDNATDLGLYLTLTTWGATWIDYDNDSWQDLYVCASSHITNYIYHNEEGTGFSLVQDEVIGAPGGDSYSSSKGDFNNDGYYDLIVSNNAPGMNFLLENNGGDNHYVKVTLEGTISNSLAIGSWIKVYCDSAEYVHYTFCGEGYLAQNSQHQIFGLGDYDGLIDSVAVTYTSGHTDTYYDLPVDSSYYFTEGETYAINISADNGLVLCQGETTTLDAGTHANIIWNDGSTSQTIEVNTSGTYSVTVENQFGIFASTEVEVVVHPNPEISFDFEPILCFGDSTGTITIENQTGTESQSVIWSNGMNGMFIDSLTAGTYAFEFTDVNGCSEEGEIILDEPSELILLVNSTPETSGMANGSISLSIFGGVAPYEVFLEGEPANQPISGLEAGTYAVLVIDQNACKQEILVEIETILSTGMPNRTGTLIYPNPARDELNFLSDIPINHVKIFGLHGKEVAQFGEVKSGIIDISFLSNGVYILKMFHNDGTLLIEKLVKQ
jgi:hypothetical protein